MPIPSRTEYCCVQPEPGTQKIFPSVSVPSISKIITDSLDTRSLSASRSRFIAAPPGSPWDCSEHRLALFNHHLEFNRRRPVLLQQIGDLLSELRRDGFEGHLGDIFAAALLCVEVGLVDDAQLRLGQLRSYALRGQGRSAGWRAGRCGLRCWRWRVGRRAGLFFRAPMPGAHSGLK